MTAPSFETCPSSATAAQYEHARYLAAVAAFLAAAGEALLSEPHQGSLDLLSAATDQLLELTAPDRPREALEALQAALRGVQDLEAIRADYQRLFAGPHRLLAPPWESVYLSEAALVMQEQTVQVREAYLRAGLAHNGLGQVPDDHIGLELQFVAALLGRALAPSICAQQPPAAALQAARDFLRQHPCRWITLLTERVVQGSLTTLYPALLRATAAVIHEATSFSCTVPLHVRACPAPGRPAH